MKILLTSVGTRGDIEPFIAIGEILNKKGHKVTLSFPENFKNLIPENLTFRPLSSKITELVESKQGRVIMGKAKIIDKIKAIIHLYKNGKIINSELVEQQYEIIENENPDLIIHNVKTNYPFLWSIKNKKRTILLSPVPYFMYYVEGHSHIGFNKNYGNLLNKLTYKISNFGLIKTIYDTQKKLPKNISYSKKEIRNNIFKKNLIYTISTSLFQRPNQWKKNVQVLGYHNRATDISNWKPSEELINFLNSYDKVIFLTFGSMMNLHPKETSELLFKELRDLGIPVIVNIASGGLTEIDKFSKYEKFLFVNKIPYDWVLKRVYAVIHHGGSGTTHLALKYGCPSLIIPHIFDQFGWNNLISELNLGPKGISINKLKSNKIKSLIFDLYNNETYKFNSVKMSESISNENLENKLYKHLVTI